MLTIIRNTVKKIGTGYKRFLRTDIREKKYKKIAKMTAAIIKYILFKKPYVLIVETGTVCNLRCPTCPTPREIIVGARTSLNMDFERFKKIMDNAHNSFSCVLLYWSNEPLLNKELVEMVAYCNKLNLCTFVSTNLTLLTERKFKELTEAGLDELLVCFDGYSPKTYERFREGAKFEIIKSKIEDICKVKKDGGAANPWIEIQYIETKQNSKETKACRQWAQAVGVDGFRIQPIYITKHLNDYKALHDEFCTEEMCAENNIKICKNPDSTVCVFVNGQTTICCYDIKGDFSYGNLIENPFKSIAQHKKYIEIKKKGRKRDLDICKRC
jgi:MoaA/NifB/PqqE/SkfB family radical SAM enzyme